MITDGVHSVITFEAEFFKVHYALTLHLHLIIGVWWTAHVIIPVTALAIVVSLFVSTYVLYIICTIPSRTL
jgi:hypothetical protein